MKAVLYYRYGSPDVLQIGEMEKPVPGEGKVLVRVRAASLNPYDWHFMTGKPYIARLAFGLRRPKVNFLGADFSGQVESVGESVKDFHPGDEVFGEVEAGAFAEYVSVSKDSIVPKPSGMTFEEAAAMPMVMLTALQGLRETGGIEAGQKVLINGASGGVGTCAVQIAKSYDAHVTGVCSTRNAEMVRDLGADHVVDYTAEDFTRGAERYDLILDNVGNRSLGEVRRALAPGGVYVSSFGLPERLWLGPFPVLIKMAVLSPLVGHRLVSFTAKCTKEALLEVKGLIETGEVRPVIDRQYALEDIAEAMRYLEEGHARGKVVITA